MIVFKSIPLVRIKKELAPLSPPSPLAVPDYLYIQFDDYDSTKYKSYLLLKNREKYKLNKIQRREGKKSTR